MNWEGDDIDIGELEIFSINRLIYDSYRKEIKSSSTGIYLDMYYILRIMKSKWMEISEGGEKIYVDIRERVA